VTVIRSCAPRVAGPGRRRSWAVWLQPARLASVPFCAQPAAGVRSGSEQRGSAAGFGIVRAGALVRPVARGAEGGGGL